MPKIHANDRSAILADWDLATFGVEPMNGIFENLYIEVQGIESRRPTFLCDEEKANSILIDHGSLIAINGVNYKVITKEPDGSGFLLLVLEKA